jgi:prolyl-tRNA synthetase
MGTVETDGASRMQELESALELQRDSFAKTMVHVAGREVVLAVVRGDQEVSPEKLAQALGTSSVRLATRDELEAIGIDPATVGPVEFPHDLFAMDLRVRVIVDEVLAASPNLVVASNSPGFHFTNVNFGRDFEGDLVADIARVLPGARCRMCGGELSRQTVIELGHIFKLGDYYSKKLRLILPDSRGRRFAPSVGAYGIGVGRLMAAVAESNHDRRGLDWPVALAPFTNFLMGIGHSAKVSRVVEGLHEEIESDTLYDDRRESISRKFKDADLIGIPYRVLISPRTLEQGKAEILERGSRMIHRVDIGCVAERLGTLREEAR